MLMRVTQRVKKQENHLEILGGGCAGAKQVRDGAIETERKTQMVNT